MNRLRELRMRSGLSQREVAKAMGISQSTLCRFELYGDEPGALTALALAEYYGVTVYELMGVRRYQVLNPELWDMRRRSNDKKKSGA